MTTDKDFKRRVRERAAKTGERYSTARMQLERAGVDPVDPLGSDPLEAVDPLEAGRGSAAHLGGCNAETNSLRNVLARLGPPGGLETPLSEAMILGIGGGLGGGYIAITHGMTGFMIGARSLWWDGVGFVRQTCAALEVPVRFAETTSAGKAAQQAAEALAAGTLPILWLDQSYLPYSTLGAWFHKGGYHVAVLYELDLERDHALLGDVGRQPFTVSAGELAAARKSITNYKHRAALLGPLPRSFDPRRAALDGIAACARDLLGGQSRSCRLDGFGTWGESVSGRGKTTWAALFPPGPHLFRALTSTYRFVEQWGGEALLRPLYAEFLDEAAQLTKRPALKQVAALYRRCGELWREVAQAALPDSVPALRSRRELLDRGRKALLTRGDAGVAEIRGTVEQLEQLAAAGAKQEFPLGRGEIDDLFADLGRRILTAYEAEKEAQRALAASVE